MKLYLAGPMSGIENHNYAAFADAAKRLRADGHEVISPAEIHPDAATIEGESEPEDYRKYLARDFAAIAECDGLALLDGWALSRGAVLEVHFALTIGLPCCMYCAGYYKGISHPLTTSFLSVAIAERVQQCDEALRDVIAERQQQDEKWGEQNHSNVWWSAILGEEFGEVSQAILHDEFGGKAAGTTRTELEQLAAVALAWIECIDRRERTT